MTDVPKRPRDSNQLAKMVVDIASGEETDTKKKRSAPNASSDQPKKINQARAAKE